jgi:hypothetical protein
MYIFRKFLRRRALADGRVFIVLATLLPEDKTEGDHEYNIMGVMHYDNDVKQNVDETPTRNLVVFACDRPVPFWGVAGDSEYISSSVGDGLQYIVFDRQTQTFQQSGIHQYTGRELFPANRSQIIETGEQLQRLLNVTVSNSLPKLLKIAPDRVKFPSYLIPSDLTPPYIVVHVDTASTTPLHWAPTVDRTGSEYQHMRETVYFICYGLDDQEVSAFTREIRDWCEAPSHEMGLTVAPTVQESLRTQSELNILAMKKVIKMEVNYPHFITRNAPKPAFKTVVLPPFRAG